MTITQPLTITRQMSAIPEVSFVGNQTFLRSSRPLIQTFLGPHLTTMKIRFIAIHIIVLCAEHTYKTWRWKNGFIVGAISLQGAFRDGTFRERTFFMKLLEKSFRRRSFREETYLEMTFRARGRFVKGYFCILHHILLQQDHSTIFQLRYGKVYMNF